MLRIISDCSAALATPKIKYFRGAGFAIQYANFLLLSEGKWCSNMASEAEGDAGNGARPSPSGSVMRVETAGGNKIEINDVWTTRILVTAVSGTGIYVVKSLVTFFRENPKLVTDVVKWVFKGWGEATVKPGSIIVDLDFGSQEKFLKFKEDFKDGKVKDALERGLGEIGYNAKLELKLIKETPNVAAVEMSKETVIRETKKISFATSNPEVVSHGERKVEKESDQKASFGFTEVKQEEKGGSAAKKPKLDPIGEPQTSRVSSTSETRKFEIPDVGKEERSSEDGHKAKKRQAVFPDEGPSTSEENEESIDQHVKKGNPKLKELEQLANNIDPSVWKKVGRELEIGHPRIIAIDRKQEEDSEKIYIMLREWTEAKGRAATWKALYKALKDAGLRKLAEKHCCENIN